MTTLNLETTNLLLTSKSALERIAFGVEQFKGGAVLLSSMQRTASVLMHMFFKLGLSNEILFVDTGFHFHETLKLRDEFMRRYRLNIVTLYPDLTPEQQEEKFGCKLWKTVEGQPVCCDHRKGLPFIQHMRQREHCCVFGGLRKKEGKARAGLKAISEDPRFEGYRINPIFDWTDDDVERYLSENGVPIHPLHEQSYPSIGCQCCTTKVAEGEDARAGRWRHLRTDDGHAPAYCNINFSDGGGI
jgi:phosphoadenosine phosphosulfate reductase